MHYADSRPRSICIFGHKSLSLSFSAAQLSCSEFNREREREREGSKIERATHTHVVELWQVQRATFLANGIIISASDDSRSLCLCCLQPASTSRTAVRPPSRAAATVDVCVIVLRLFCRRRRCRRRNNNQISIHVRLVWFWFLGSLHENFRRSSACNFFLFFVFLGIFLLVVLAALLVRLCAAQRCT